MALNIIRGRSGTGKSTFLIKLMQKEIEKGGPVFLLVPEQYSLQAEARFLKESKSQGLMANEILSFKRMAYRVLSNYGGLARTKLNPSGRIMILNHVLGKYNGELTFLKNLSEKQGETNRLLSLIDEFGRYEVSPEILYKAGEEADNVNLKEKLKDLGFIYSKYREVLLNNHIDDEDIYESFLRKLKEKRPYEGSHIFLDSFWGFTSYEFDIIKELLKQAENIYICLTLDEKSNFIFERVEKTYGQLMRICQETGCHFKIFNMKENYRFKNNPHLGHLEENYAKYPAKKKEGKVQGIEIRECKNRYEELEAVARSIVSLLKEEGLRYKDIAISARNLEDYEKIINAIFPKYEIPYFLDLKKNIEDHPLIRLIFSLLEIVAGSWDYSSIFDFLKTDLYFENKDSIDLLENYVIARGIRGKRAWSRDFDLDEGLNKVREKIFLDLSTFEEDFRAANTMGDLAKTLILFFSRLNIEDRIKLKTKRLKEENQAILSNEYARIWNISMEVIEQIYIFLKDTRVQGPIRQKARTFRDALKSGFSEYKIGFIPYTDDSIQFGSADRTRSHNIKALFLIGANEGIFPTTFSDQGFLKDRDRLFLQGKGIELAEDNGTKAQMEYNYIYNTLTSASCKLYVSYCLEGDDQGEMRPSVIVKRIQKIFPDLEIIKDYKVKITDKITRPKAFLLDNISQLKEDKSPQANAIRHWYWQSDEFKGLFKTYMEADWSFKKDIYLDKDLMDELFNKNLYLSATSLQKYNACPYAFFMDYGIRAKKREDHSIEAQDVGSLMHTFMENAQEQLAKEEDDIDLVFDSVFDESMAKAGLKRFLDSHRNTYLARRLLRITKEVYINARKQVENGLLKPAGYEKSFDIGGDLDPIKIDVDGRQVLIKGRIDRYDTYETESAIYFRVIDYKSSKWELSPNDILWGQNLQLITYIDAVAKDYEKKTKKDIVPIAAFYFTMDSDTSTQSNRPSDDQEASKSKYHVTGLIIDDPEILSYNIKERDNPLIKVKGSLEEGFELSAKKHGLPKEAFGILRKGLYKSVKETYKKMESGCISIEPTYYNGKKACEYCQFKSICGLDRSKIENFKIIPKIETQEALDLMGKTD